MAQGAQREELSGGAVLYVVSAVHSRAKEGGFVPVTPPGSRDCVVFAVDIKTASIVWTYTCGNAELHTSTDISQPIMSSDGERLYVAQPEGPLHAIDASSGRAAWPMPFGAARKSGSAAGVVQCHAMPGIDPSNTCVFVAGLQDEPPAQAPETQGKERRRTSLPGGFDGGAGIGSLTHFDFRAYSW